MQYHHFEVLQRLSGEPWVLGVGAGGTTYKARDASLQRFVALKVVSAAGFKTEEAKERFLAEAQTAASLRHPNLAAIYYFGEQDGDCFYAMEFVDGCTLEELVEKEGALAADLSLAIASQVAAALGVAHEAGLIHRDVKPANILLTHSADGGREARLIDFGLAAGANEVAGERSAFAGTPLFASPEQLDEVQVDARSDVYSLGATLFYMLCGRPPYLGSVSQIVTQHTLQPTPVDLISSSPSETIALVRRLMKKDADQRPVSGSQARAEIEVALRGIRPDAKSTALEWLTKSFGVLSRGGAVDGGLLYTVAKERDGDEFNVLHLDHSAPGLAAADRFRFALPRLWQLGNGNIRKSGRLVEVADGLLVVGVVPEPSTRLLSVMRVRRRLPAGEARQILGPLADALDAAAQEGLAIPNLGLRDIELRPPEDPKTPLDQWPGLTACIDLLPVAEATPVGASATIVGSSLVTSGRIMDEEGLPPAAVIASLAYEMLGGMTAPSAGHYVPLPELNEEQNRLLRETLASPASGPSAGEIVATLFGSPGRIDSGQRVVRNGAEFVARSSARPRMPLPVRRESRVTGKRGAPKRETTTNPGGRNSTNGLANSTEQSSRIAAERRPLRALRYLAWLGLFVITFYLLAPPRLIAEGRQAAGRLAQLAAMPDFLKSDLQHGRKELSRIVESSGSIGRSLPPRPASATSGSEVPISPGPLPTMVSSSPEPDRVGLNPTPKPQMQMPPISRETPKPVAQSPKSKSATVAKAKPKPPVQSKRRTGNSLPQYISIDTIPSGAGAGRSVMIYDTKSRKVVGNQVYNLKQQAPTQGKKFDTEKAQYIGR